MSLILVCLASAFLALANLFMRKSLDAGGTTKTYLVIQLSVCLVISTLLGPIKTGAYAINGPIVGFGLLNGVVLIGILSSLSKALEKGPAGLTFAILSAAAVFPGLVMAAFLGPSYGFIYTPWHAIGSSLVLVGLFWAGREVTGAATCERSGRHKMIWAMLVTAMFLLHIAILILYQFRALVLATDPTSLITAQQMGSEWFVPMMYLGASSIQLVFFLAKERRRPKPKEWIYGFVGGLCNSFCTLFLLASTQMATGLENAIIFPMYSIGTILFSNLWSQRLYKEKINWRACQVCSLGIILGSVDWKVALAALGI